MTNPLAVGTRVRLTDEGVEKVWDNADTYFRRDIAYSMTGVVVALCGEHVFNVEMRLDGELVRSHYIDETFDAFSLTDDDFVEVIDDGR